MVVQKAKSKKMKGAPVVGPASQLDKERDMQAFRLISWNNWYLKILLQWIPCCHHYYLFFTPVNSYIQEIKRKNSKLFYWEDCEERNQQARRNSVCATRTLLFENISMHIFTFKRTCVCSLFLQVWISPFLGVPMQIVVAWDGACKTLVSFVPLLKLLPFFF